MCRQQTYSQTVQSFNFYKPKAASTTATLAWNYFSDTTYGKITVSPSECVFPSVDVFSDSGLSTANDGSVVTSVIDLAQQKVTFSFSQATAFS